MTEYSFTEPSIVGPRSPMFGTATFSTLSATQTPMSPSRLSTSTRSLTPVPSSYDSDDVPSERRMRRIIVSPSPSSRDSDSDCNENSVHDAAQVERTLSMIDDELEQTEDVLTEWSRGSSDVGPSTYSSYTGYTGTASDSAVSGDIYSTTTNTVLDRNRRVLSTISEHTENVHSRPMSFAQSGGTQGSRLNTFYSNDGGRTADSPSLHVRSATEPSSHMPGRALPTITSRTGELIAFFEDKTTPTPGHARTASAPSGPRSPILYTTTTPSRSMPTFATSYGYGSTSYGSEYSSGYGSGSSSPTKGPTGSSLSASGPITTMSSLLSPPPRAHSALSGESRTMTDTQTSNTRSGASTYTGPTTATDTFTRTLTSSGISTSTATPTVAFLRRPQTSPRSPLTSVRNVMAAWKERTPSLGKSARSTASPSPTQSEGLFSVRRRDSMRARNKPSGGRQMSEHSTADASAAVANGSGSGSLSTNGLLPPAFDIEELGQYANARGNQAPLRIGLLWYLNVHAPPPYRWQRCQALLYPHMLLLSWIAPGGGRGIVTLDLLNCTEVRSAPTPIHPAGRDDIGTIAARLQSSEENVLEGGPVGDLTLMETLHPFQLIYSDGIERLGAESARERVRWVSAIYDVLARPVSIPDRSETRSPAGSIRTINSMTSTNSTRSGTGSVLTTYVPPMDTIPDLSDIQSISGSSIQTGLSRRRSTLASPAHRTRAIDDGAVSSRGYLYPGDPRVIAPSRSSSLRRTSSLTDLDQEFDSALRRARESRPGLGFGLGLASGVPIGDGTPVTVSSGPSLGRDVYMSPPPSSVERGSDRARSRISDCATSISDEAFFSAESRTNSTTAPTSSFYSSSSFTKMLTSTGDRTTSGLATDETALDIVSGSGTNIVPSTLSLRGPSSNSMLGDSHESHSGTTTSNTYTSPSGSGLSRSREIRRRTPGSASRSYSTSYLGSGEDSSDKENSESYSAYESRSTTEGLSTSETYTRSDTFTPSGSYTTSEPYTPTDTYTPTPSSYYTRSGSERSAAAEETGSTPESTPVTSEYVTAKTPSSPSFVSLDTIPSESDFETAEVCSTEYETAPKCPSEPNTDYETVEICPTEPPTSEYVTAEVCPTEVSTDYDTAECRCLQREADVISVEVPPSEIPSIPDSVTEEEGELPLEPEEPEPETPRPEDIPLPPSTYSPTVASRELLESERETPTASPVPTPSTEIPSDVLLSSTESIPFPSPIPPPESLPHLNMSLSTITSPTESSVSPTPSSMLTPTIPSTIEQPPTPSSPAIPESIWGVESDGSYDSSLLRASPSVQSLAVPEGLDTSFETSFLRPSGSVASSQELTLLTPITEISSEPSVSIPLSPESPSLTPTPSSASIPPSVPLPTPISPEPSATLLRTLSSVSTVSSVSMSSSIFDARSLLDVPSVVEPSVVSPSTEPSLLSTARSRSPLPRRAVSPRGVPLPPSPSPSAPSVTMSVSLSTPRREVPSVLSTIETIPSEAPSTILTHDVNRLLQYLHEADGARGEESRELADNVQQLRDEVADLADYLHHVCPPDKPPPVPHKDRSVGGSSVISAPRSGDEDVVFRPPSAYAESTISPPPSAAVPSIVVSAPRLAPLGPRDFTRVGVRATIVPEDPERILSPDSSESDVLSFLSSHHSDDISLLESETYPVRAPSPSWPSDSSPSPESSPRSSPRSSSVSLRPRSSLTYSDVGGAAPNVPLTATPRAASPAPALPSLTPPPLSPTPPPSSPTPPPSSPTPSSSSSGTARPMPVLNLGHLRDILDGIRGQVDAISHGQDATNRGLDDLRSRPTEHGWQECCEKIRRMEDTLQRLVDLAQQAQRPPRDDVSSVYASDDSLIDRLVQAQAQGDRASIEAPPLHAPIPRRAGPSFDEQLADLMAAGPPPPQPPVQEPPQLIPLRYRPGPRASRPRSASPLFEANLPPRPGTFPLTTPATSRVPFQPIPHRAARPGPAPSEAEGEGVYPPPVVPTGPMRSEGARRQDLPDGWWDGPPGRPRPPTAPPALGGEDSRRRPAAPPVPPPGVFTEASAPAPAGAPPAFVPIATAPTVLQLPPTWNELVTVLRDNRDATNASIDQGQEIVRYLTDLNRWLSQDVLDRQREISSVHARLRELGDQVGRVLPGGQPQMAVPVSSGGIVPPPPVLMPGAAVPQPIYVQPQDEYRRTPRPARPARFPESRSPSPDYTLGIPPVVPVYQQGPPVVPVIPDPNLYPPPPLLQQQEPIVYRPEVRDEESEGFVPEALSDEGSEESPPRPIFIPPPQVPPFTVVPPALVPVAMPEPTVVGLPPSQVPTSPHYHEEYSDYEPDHTPSPEVIHIAGPPAPTEPRIGSPRHPDAPSSQPPFVISAPGVPAQMPSAVPPVSTQPLPAQMTEVPSAPARMPRPTASEREEPHAQPATVVVRTHRTPSPSQSSVHRTHRSRSRSPALAPPVVVQPPMGVYPGQQMPMPMPMPMPVPASGISGPMIPTQRTRSRTRSPSPIVIRTEGPSDIGPRRTPSYGQPYQEGDPGDHMRRTPSYRRPYQEGDPGDHMRRPSPPPAVHRSPSPISRRPHSRRSTSPPIIVRAERPPSRYSTVRHPGEARRSPPILVQGEPHRAHSPIYMHPSEPTVVHVPRPESPGDYEHRRPPRDRPHRISRSEYEEPDRAGSPGRPYSPVPHDRPSRTPREPHRPPATEREPSASPPRDVRAPSGMTERRSMRSPRPTVIRVDEGEPIQIRSPSPSLPHVVHVRSQRRPSQVTARTYGEASPLEAEHIAISRTPSDVSVRRQAYEAADRPTTGVTRAPTHRTVRTEAERGVTPVEEEPEQIHHIPSVAQPMEPVPTVSRPRTLAPSVPVAPPLEEHEEPPFEGYIPPAMPVPEPSTRRPYESPPRTVMEVEPRRLSGPGDLGYADAERERQERFGELERQLTGNLDAFREAEERRDEVFRDNEDDRDRIFTENEARRNQEALQRTDEIMRDLEERIDDRLGQVAPGASPLPVPPPGLPEAETEAEVPPAEPGAPTTPDTQSIVESIRTVQDAATRHAAELFETIRMEREEQAHERELAQAERERLQAEKDAEIARRLEEQQARIRALEEENSALRAELANERQLRLTDAEARENDRAQWTEQVDALRNQLTDVTNITSETRDEVARKREASDQRWAEKLTWKTERDAQMAALRETVEQIIADREACKAEKQARREAKAGQPTIEEIMNAINTLREAQRDQLASMAESWRADCAHYHEMTMEAIRQNAHEQIPFNIQGYLDEFSRSLADEVRMLLGEVGKLHSERRNLQYEIGCLLKMRAKYGPGGEFDPDWRPTTGPCAGDGGAPGGAPPPEAPPPPPPEEPAPARPAWRPVRNPRSRRNRPAAAAPPPPPEAPPPPHVSSWATWQPDPAFVPTPPSGDATLLSPPVPTPGLFGPRSPRDSLHQG